MNYCFSIAEEEFDRLTKNSKMEEGRTPRSGKFVSEAALGSRIIFPIVTSVAGKFYLDAFSLFPLFPLCSVTLTLPLPRERERERELERYEWPLNRREPDDGVWGRCKIRYRAPGIYRGLFQSDEHNGITRCTALFFTISPPLVDDNNLDSLGGVN